MQLLQQSLRVKADGVEIDGPHGTVQLRLIHGQIIAEYTGHELVNGSAQAYANELLARAIEFTVSYPLPWTYDADGHQRITDPYQFYRQTFEPHVSGIERLFKWIHACKAKQSQRNLRLKN